MLEKIIRFAIAHRWLMLAADAGARRPGRVELHAPADRCHARHHQRPGADQHRSAGLFSPLEAEQRVTCADRDRARRARRGSTTRARSRATASRRSPSCSTTAPTSVLRAPAGGRAHPAGAQSQLPAGLRAGDGPHRRPAWARSSCTRWKPARRAQAADGTPCTATDLRTLQDWVVRPQLRNAAGRHRGEHDRRLRAADPRHAGSGAPGRAVASRSHDVVERGGRAQQPPTSAPATSSATASNSWCACRGRWPTSRHCATSCSTRRDGVPIRVARRRRRRRGPGAAHAARPRRTGSEVVLGTVFMLIGENSRERRAGGGDAAAGDRTAACPPACGANPVYDRTTLVERTIAHRRRRTWSKARCSSSWCCSCCSATCARR